MATITFDEVAAATGSELVSGKKLLWATPLTGVIAAVLNTIVFYFYAAIGFNIILPLPDLTDPTQPTTPLLLMFVVVFTFLPALAAGSLLWVLSKFTRRPLTVFTILAVVGLVLSFGASAPLDMPLAFKLGLDVMHVVAGITIISGLTRWARE